MAAATDGFSLPEVMPYALLRLGLAAATHSSLFRYVGLQSGTSWDLLTKTIVHHRLPLALIGTLNDPFDSDPVIVNDATPKQVQDFLRRGVRLNSQGEPSPFDWTAAKISTDDNTILSTADLEARAIAAISKIWSEQSKKSYVGSFCRRISSQLLWSHYADKYKGLAYHFVVRDDVLRFARPVDYERQRPIILLSEIIQQIVGAPPDATSLLYWQQRTYLTKSVEWAYEEESRIIASKSEIEFAPEALAAVIVGPFFSSDNLAELRKIISQRENRLPIFRAHIARTDYAIEIDWSSPL